MSYSDRFIADTAKQKDTVLCTSGAEITGAFRKSKNALIMAVEDARLLCGNINRLQALYNHGVRILTLLWGGNTIIGGSHDTENTLTDFGEQTVRRCFELGIIPDISHASEASAARVLEISGQTGCSCIASHSNSYSVCPFSRNLSDANFEKLLKVGGICGITFVPDFISSSKPATIDGLLLHIEHFLSLGGAGNISVGSDFDGVDELPEGIHNVADTYKIADRMAAVGYSDSLIEDILFHNACNFFIKNLIEKDKQQ